MKLKNTTLFALLAILLSACGGQSVEKTDNGIVVTVKPQSANDVRKVRLEVMGEKLIHVSATPANAFSKKASLCVLPAAEATPFSVTEDETTVSLSTTQVTATVDKATGEVTFSDSEGNVILAEDHGGRTFTPIEIEGTKAYSVRQVFASTDDEAFYGLGQHQADEFNYKSKNEELYQYNTKVSIPFIVSNKQYGLLWDSYSLCRFGDPRDYAQLHRAFRLYDKDGVEGALTGTYEPAEKTRGTVVRREDSLYFENLKTIKNLPAEVPLYGAHVTYEGYLEPQESGVYRFILYYAGYTKISIDGQTVVPERWRTAWNPNSYKFSVDMEANRRVPILIEWEPDGGESYCGLRALTPVSDEEQGKQSWWGQMQDEINYYFVYGPTPDEVISGYRTLTGKSQILPRWAMGFWQSRERYKTQDELLATLAEFRTRRIPIDNIVQDWSYWPENAWGSHEFDAERFPDPKAMVDSVHAMNAHVMISVWPKFYTSTEHYKEFDANGWMYQQSVRDSLRDWIGEGYHYSFYDAYDAGARRLFWQQMRDHLYPLGFDAWWMDASEPNVRDCTDLEYRQALCGPTALGPSAQYFNAYALMNAEAIYNGQRGEDPDRRVFLLTRSGFAGLQRYSTATWSGDIATRWEDMKAQISAGLNFAISGIPYWTMDIGGFCVEKRYEEAQHEYDRSGRENEDYREWRELNARWFQFGSFCPLYRAHGQYPYREIWNIAPEGHPLYNSMLYYTRLRYRLMPYIYSLAGMTHFDDYTIMRPLIMDFTADTGVNNIGDQFMFGPALMIAPVTTYGARSREVYLPEGGWYDFYTGKHLDGGQTIDAPAPYERIPVFVREGSILPVGPEMQYADEKPASDIALYVYTGRDAKFTLYEDENVNYNYEQGAYATIPFSYDEATGILTIGERQGSFEGMLTTRTFRVIKVSPEKAGAFNPDAKGITVNYDGSSREIDIR